MIHFKISDYGKSLGITNADLFFLRGIFQEEDPQSVEEQINTRYAHGGGFDPMEGWTLFEGWEKEGDARMSYPGSELEDATEVREIARGQVRGTILVLFDYEFLAIIKPDGAFQVTRVD